MQAWLRNVPWVLYLFASVLFLATAVMQYAAGGGLFLTEVAMVLACGSLGFNEWQRSKEELPSPEVLPKALGMGVRWRPVWATLVASLVLVFAVVVLVWELP